MKKTKILELEFIALMAFLMANVALSIDTILPGLTDIGKSIHNTDSTDLQLIITMIFLGLGIGQLFFGSFSDNFGRKPVVYFGMGIFILSSIVCVTASDLKMMLIGRVLQGVGLSAPRTICVSIIRDLYRGNNMARIMSFIEVIFIIVPMIAPVMGQLILDIFNWEAIFIFQLFFAIATLIWFIFRQKETLLEEYKIKLSGKVFVKSTKEFFKYRASVIYTIMSGFIIGAFMVYLSTSKQIFQDQYDLKEEFVYIFAALAFVMGSASFLNGSLVLKFGMLKLVKWSLYLFCFASLTYSILYFNSENPNITILLLFFTLQLIPIGFLFGNTRALAMEPIGHIAGIGAAINGFVSTVMAVPIAIGIGIFINTSVLPLFIGFLCCGLISIFLLNYLKYKEQ